MRMEFCATFTLKKARQSTTTIARQLERENREKTAPYENKVLYHQDQENQGKNTEITLRISFAFNVIVKFSCQRVLSIRRLKKILVGGRFGSK